MTRCPGASAPGERDSRHEAVGSGLGCADRLDGRPRFPAAGLIVGAFAGLSRGLAEFRDKSRATAMVREAASELNDQMNAAIARRVDERLAGTGAAPLRRPLVPRSRCGVSPRHGDCAEAREPVAAGHRASPVCLHPPRPATEPEEPREPSLAEQGFIAARDWLLGGNTIVRVGLVILFVGPQLPRASWRRCAGCSRSSCGSRWSPPLAQRCSRSVSTGARRTPAVRPGAAGRGRRRAVPDRVRCGASVRADAAARRLRPDDRRSARSAWRWRCSRTRRRWRSASFAGGFAVPILLGGDSDDPAAAVRLLHHPQPRDPVHRLAPLVALAQPARLLRDLRHGDGLGADQLRAAALRAVPAVPRRAPC